LDTATLIVGGCRASRPFVGPALRIKISLVDKKLIWRKLKLVRSKLKLVWSKPTTSSYILHI
jgi:hypothetical protein